MTIATNSPPMTTEELLALPDDGMERDLIQGQLREKEMPRRNPFHSETLCNIVGLLVVWLKSRPRPRGKIVGAEAGFRISKSPDTTVGIDVAYISAELAATVKRGMALIDGPPILAVEILSPSDQQEEISDKVQAYLDSGVKLIWVADPVFRTVCVYRPDAPPVLFNDTQELTGEPHLPGFRSPVAEVFSA
jgi:Uma2 family endonuclease